MFPSIGPELLPMDSVPASNNPLRPSFGFLGGLSSDNPRFAHDLPGGLLGLPDALFGGLLDVPHGLICLAPGTQFVVAGQRARRFLDATLHYFC